MMHWLLILVSSIALLASTLIGLMFLSSRQASAATTTVQAGNFWFCNSASSGSVCETTINQGDTVVWSFPGGYQHTTTACGASCDSPTSSPLWDSGPVMGASFQFTFTQPGTYLYHCQVHPSLMMGRIVVLAAPTPTLVTSGTFPIVTAPATSTPAGGQLPPSGQGPQSGESDWWLLAALAAFGGAATALGVLALVRRPR